MEVDNTKSRQLILSWLFFTNLWQEYGFQCRGNSNTGLGSSNSLCLVEYFEFKNFAKLLKLLLAPSRTNDIPGRGSEKAFNDPHCLPLWRLSLKLVTCKYSRSIIEVVWSEHIMEKWTVGLNLSQFRQHTAVRIRTRANKALLAKRSIKSRHLKCLLMN